MSGGATIPAFEAYKNNAKYDLNVKTSALNAALDEVDSKEAILNSADNDLDSAEAVENSKSINNTNAAQIC